MSLVFLCLVPVFAERTGLDRSIRWLFLASFAATLISFVLVSVVAGPVVYTVATAVGADPNVSRTAHRSDRR